LIHATYKTEGTDKYAGEVGYGNILMQVRAKEF